MKFIDKEKEVVYDDSEEWLMYEVILRVIFYIIAFPVAIIMWWLKRRKQ